MNVNRTLFCGLTSLTLTLSGLAGDHIGKSYSVREISFFDNGFPKQVKIRLYGHSTESFLPCQSVVSAERIVNKGINEVSVVEMFEGIEVVELAKADDRHNQNVIEITMNMKSCIPLKFFDRNNPEKWTFVRISGPRMALKKDAAFVPIIRSKNHLIGFVLASTKGDKGIIQWKKSLMSGPEQN